MTVNYGFLKDLAPNEAVITANRRLSTHLQHHYDQIQLSLKRAWLSPKICPLSQWLSELWAQSYSSELLLDSIQSRFIWQEIVQTESDSAPLLDTLRAAELAQQAWQLLQQWNLPLSRLENEESEDIKIFVHWAKCYQDRCKKENYCDVAELSDRILGLFQRSALSLPQKIYLVGFDSFAPAIQTMFDTFSRQVNIIIPPLLEPAHQTQRLAIKDRESEFRIMAQWAKQQWQRHSQQSIACLIPELLSERNSIERIFREEFSEQFHTTVNIAGGNPLISYPIIQTALSLLNLIAQAKLPHCEITALLLSPFIGGAKKEIYERAAFDRGLAQCRNDNFNLNALIDQLHSINHCTEFRNLLIESKSLLLCSSKAQYPSQWARFFVDIFSHFGWPGEESLDSQHYQLVSSFQQQLRYYSGLDWLFKEQSLLQAITSFRQLLSKALFQAETEQNVPIQVLGILEASGLHFDQLWISNLNDDCWPRPPSPNPFLPVHLQRELSMPRSSATHELQYAEQIMHRCRHSTKTLITSYSTQNSEEQRELAPSPLILDFKEIQISDLNLTALEAPVANPQTEAWEDNQAPPLKPDEKIRGGATVLKRQAECPFWAFAEIRLQAKPFEEVELGLSAAERGSLVHSVLAQIWQQLKNSEELQQMDDQQLKSLVENTVTKVVRAELEISEKSEDNNKNLMLNPLSEIEIQRLKQLLLQWLELEKKRSAFTVSAIEKPFSLTLGKLALHLQVDRIDTLEDGSKIIIDYKTGSPSPSSWLGDRPEEPQLPLYALQDPFGVRGLAFGQIRSQSVKFNGLTAQAAQLPGVKASATEWSELIEQWKSALNNLADEFSEGNASVTPKNFPTTCSYCHLASVCRIYERESISDD